MTRLYRLSGLKLSSDFDLPALPAWDGPPHRPADLAFRRGTVPVRLEAADHIAPTFQTRGGSEYLLALPGTGRILIRNGNAVTVEPAPEAEVARLSAILTGPIQAVLWHQRGLLPLHASVIGIDGQAVALCGHSAAGKSTLAAVLAARGHAVIADDIGLIDASADGRVSVLSGCARLRLWGDALDHLGITTRGLVPALSGKEKYFFDCQDGISRAAHRLAAVVLLSRQWGGAVTLERLRGAAVAGALYGVVRMRRPAHALGRGPDIFTAVTRLASAGVTIWRLNVTDGLAHLPEAAAKVLTLVEA
jgi:hypothetical protein